LTADVSSAVKHHRYTTFDSWHPPVIKKLSASLLFLLGWRLEKNIPDTKKVIIIGAPHTSNWDFPLALLAMSALGMRFFWIGKHTLFKEPFGTVLRAIGGIPVNRQVRDGFINDIVSAFTTADQLTLGIAPEGTRSKKDHWKGGFYHIAVQANIEICLGFIDYPSKTIGLGPTLRPTRDIVHDFALIKTFYQDKKGKHPQQQSTICLREKEIALFQKEYAQAAATGSGRSAS
jgi:1-acyl-sn-glycerol-3-phosphate acyltransferase